MNSAFLAFILFSAALDTAYGNWPVRIEPDINIYPAANLRHGDGVLGVVYGARSCGGPGKFIEWRAEDCDTTNSPCRYPVDEHDRHGEIEFIPSATIEQLGFRIVYKYPDSPPETVFETTLPNSRVVAGVQQVLSTNGHVTKDVKSKTIVSQFILYRLDNQEIELCAEADYELIQNGI